MSLIPGGTTSFFYPSFFFHPSFYFQVILPSFFKEKPSFFLSILPSFIMYTSFFFLFLCIQPSFFPIPFFFYVFLSFVSKTRFSLNSPVPALSTHQHSAVHSIVMSVSLRIRYIMNKITVLKGSGIEYYSAKNEIA